MAVSCRQLVKPPAYQGRTQVNSVDSLPSFRLGGNITGKAGLDHLPRKKYRRNTGVGRHSLWKTCKVTPCKFSTGLLKTGLEPVFL